MLWLLKILDFRMSLILPKISSTHDSRKKTNKQILLINIDAVNQQQLCRQSIELGVCDWGTDKVVTDLEQSGHNLS